jgi:hypothetical protein
MWDIHRAQRLFLIIQMTATLGINNQVSETLEMTVELKSMPQATNMIKQILSFLAYGGSSIVMALN